jgi:hypothetical protein
MDPSATVAMLLALMRQLEDVMRLEGTLLREMRLDRLRELQGEKSALATDLEARLQGLRRAAGTVGGLDMAERSLLEESLRSFRATAHANVARLRQAREVSEGLVRLLGESLAYLPAGGGRAYGPAAGGGGGPAETARIIPVAFDRQC